MLKLLREINERLNITITYLTHTNGSNKENLYERSKFWKSERNS